MGDILILLNFTKRKYQLLLSNNFEGLLDLINPIPELPYDIYEQILSYVDPRTLRTTSRVNRELNLASNRQRSNESFWKENLEKEQDDKSVDYKSLFRFRTYFDTYEKYIKIRRMIVRENLTYGQIGLIPQSDENIINRNNNVIDFRQSNLLRNLLSVRDLYSINWFNFPIYSGIIPIELQELNNLQSLTITNSRISVIPSYIKYLSNISYLNLSHNDILVIPPEIGDLTGITLLDLSHNKIAEIPSQIVKLRFLKKLNLDYNNIKSISYLPGSFVINVYENPIEYIHQSLGRTRVKFTESKFRYF